MVLDMDFVDPSLGKLNIHYHNCKLWFSVKDIINLLKNDKDNENSDIFIKRLQNDENKYLIENEVFAILTICNSDFADRIKKWIVYEIIPNLKLRRELYL